MSGVVETIEEVIEDVWYQYDIRGDVLRLRHASERDTASMAEETPDGFVLLRAQRDHRVIGLTIPNWWNRFGGGDLPDSLQMIQRRIEPWARRSRRPRGGPSKRPQDGNG